MQIQFVPLTNQVHSRILLPSRTLSRSHKADLRTRSCLHKIIPTR